LNPGSRKPLRILISFEFLGIGVAHTLKDISFSAPQWKGQHVVDHELWVFDASIG